MKEFKLEHHRMMELKHFCRQYKIWKDYCDAIDGFPKLNFSQGEHSGKVSNPTVTAVERREEYLEKIALIDKACKLSDERLERYLLIAVTEGVSYYGLRCHFGMQACKREYHEAYAKFFYILDKTRK